MNLSPFFAPSFAGNNLIIKQVATISGVALTLIFFVVFELSERINARRRAGAHVELDQFQLHPEEELSPQAVGLRPGSTLCLVRDYNNLGHVAKALELTHTGKKNLVVMTVRIARGPDAGYEDLDVKRLFSAYEQQLCTRAVVLAEKAGKHVDLLVVPSSDLFQAAAITAAQLDSHEIYAGRSGVMTPEEQARKACIIGISLPWHCLVCRRNCKVRREECSWPSSAWRVRTRRPPCRHETSRTISADRASRCLPAFEGIWYWRAERAKTKFAPSEFHGRSLWCLSVLVFCAPAKKPSRSIWG